MTKVLIFDSGALINLAMNGLLDILESLKKEFDGKFIMSREVKYEVIDHPVGISRFELEALRIQKLIDSKVIEFPSAVGISDEILRKETERVMNIANHSVMSHGNWIKLVSEAEMSCIALSNKLEQAGTESMIAIDERTTRILSERPANLEKIMADKMHRDIELNQETLKNFPKCRFIRSSELVFVAYKKGLIDLEGKKVLEALLYATKFKGAAISFEEIDELKKL
jgi:hypothetical protein